MAFSRKRVYAGRSSGRSYKRGKFVRRSRRRFARGRNKTWTSQSATGNQYNYRSRKLRPRAWRRKLWNDTLAKTHYRSSGNGAGTLATQTTIGSATVSIFFPTFIGTPGPTTAFWTTTGGLVTPDTGETAPTFGPGDIVIRGGRIGITITCPDAVTEEIGVTIWVVRLTNDPNVGAIGATLPYGSMIDINPDFAYRVGKVLYNKQAILSGAYPSFTLEHRMRVEKIDKEIFGTELGHQVAFIVAIANLQTTDARTLSTIAYHDLSFTADAIT